MNAVILLKILLLIVIANGAPILAKRIFNNRFTHPIDFGIRFVDHRPLLGPTKTYRGLLAAILATSVAALALSLPVYIGILIAAFAMLGDLISSFAKRRLGIASSDMALGIDQIPEALLPLLVVGSQYKLDGTQIMLAVVAFFAIELILSRVLYNLKIRDRPH